jgi:hypothetical protein
VEDYMEMEVSDNDDKNWAGSQGLLS